jgi:uncharacterized protein YerC
MWEILNVLRRLHRGEPHASISRATSHSRSTIRRYARAHHMVLDLLEAASPDEGA